MTPKIDRCHVQQEGQADLQWRVAQMGIANSHANNEVAEERLAAGFFWLIPTQGNIPITKSTPYSSADVLFFRQ